MILNQNNKPVYDPVKEYEKGKSYAAIAEKLNAKVKSVDTAIQRIRKKANKIKESIAYSLLFISEF